MTEHPHLPTAINQHGQGQWLQSFAQLPTPQFATPVVLPCEARLIRLDEINEEHHHAYQQALANVYATLDAQQPVRLLYLLDGTPTGVSLYFGVVSDTPHIDLHEAMKNLRGALEGQLPGINFGGSIPVGAARELLERLNQAPYQGVMLGAPTKPEQANPNEEQNYQGLDRLVRALQSGSKPNQLSTAGRWQLAIVSQPLPRSYIRKQLDAAYTLSSELAALVRTSVQASSNTSRQKSASYGSSEASGTNDGISLTRGRNETATNSKSRGSSSGTASGGLNSGSSTSTAVGSNESRSDTKGSSHTTTTTDNFSLSDTSGNTLGITQEIANKRAQHLMDYVDKQLIVRLQKGFAKGLFHTAMYFAADTNSLYQRLKNTLRATFQGQENSLSPLETHELPKAAHGHLLRLPHLESDIASDELLFHSLHCNDQGSLGSLLTADELAIVASLPERELQGVRRRKSVDFIIDLPDVHPEGTLDLGEIIDRGRRYPSNRVRLTKADLNKHTFITGVTGAGKTTTCLNLLLESELPFLVIEPAKTEYRVLAASLGNDIAYYRPNGDQHQSLRINPFALVRDGQQIKSHAGFLKNVFAAIFPMEASMPMMVEAAILAAYEDKGWDLDENEFLPGGDPFDPATRAWPTMSDMIGQLDRLIPTYGLGKEFEEKYRGSLVSRLRGLTDGTLGRVLDVPQSLSFDSLLQRNVVIELEELQSGEEKALLMALLLGGINEAIRARHANNKDFRHLTLIEEAHRLLSRPESGNHAAAMAVEAFADMLAEVRKYGEGLIIADQIPAKLIPDIIKNTHTKIVHRLFAEDDRHAMGEAMMMDDEQRGFLPNLGVGEAIVFCGGWHGPTHAAIRNDRAQTDNHTTETFDIHHCGQQQLWQERARYHPHFCRLSWLSQNDGDAAHFARFVRETRQAHNQFLRLLGNTDKHTTTAKQAFTRLRQWHQQWQPLATASQNIYTAWRAQNSEEWPENLLAAAWLALIFDANPQPHANEINVPPLQPKSPMERSIRTAASQNLLQLIQDHDELENFRAACSAIRQRDLMAHLDMLKRFKKI